MPTFLTTPNWLIEKPFAHRGLHDNILIPENSLASFENAIKNNYSIELDVHLLCDGNLAVFHDDNIERMCGESIKISTLDKSTIKRYNLLNTVEEIPLLQAVLDMVSDRVPLLIEVKNFKNIGVVENALSEIMCNYKGRYAIQSFNPFSLNWFRKNAPSVLRGQLSSDFKNEKMFFLLKAALKRFVFNFKSKPHFISYDYQAMPAKHVQQLRNKGMIVLCWTIRSQKEDTACSSYCDNIIFEGFQPPLRQHQ